MKSTWRFVMKIVGLSLALAGAICLVIGFWDKLAEDAVAAPSSMITTTICCASDPARVRRRPSIRAAPQRVKKVAAPLF